MESPEVYTEVYRKARKTHRCACCFREITRSTHYMECTGIWAGAPDRFRIHKSCYELYRKLSDRFHFDDPLPFEELETEARECGHAWPPPLEDKQRTLPMSAEGWLKKTTQ